MDGLIDKADFQDRQSRLETETTDAKRLLAAGQISHEGVLAVVDTCVKLLQYAGVLYRQMPGDSRQTFTKPATTPSTSTPTTPGPRSSREPTSCRSPPRSNPLSDHKSAPLAPRPTRPASRPDEPATTTPPHQAHATAPATAPPWRIAAGQNRTPATSTMTWVPT